MSQVLQCSREGEHEEEESEETLAMEGPAEEEDKRTRRWRTEEDSDEESNHYNMNSGFRRPWRRESGLWLERQNFWRRMSLQQKQEWLQFREGESMECEDLLRWREKEIE